MKLSEKSNNVNGLKKSDEMTKHNTLNINQSQLCIESSTVYTKREREREREREKN